MSAVFDASVVVKWFIDDPLTDAAIGARRAYGAVVAPDLMLVEAANTFRRYVVRGDLQPSAARDNLAVLASLVDATDHGDLLAEAFAMACDLNHSMTDCLYAVLARRRALPLITADGKLARKLLQIEGLDVQLLDLPESAS